MSKKVLAMSKGGGELQKIRAAQSHEQTVNRLLPEIKIPATVDHQLVKFNTCPDTVVLVLSDC